MQRRSHHLADEVFTESPLPVLLTLCTVDRCPLFRDDRRAEAAVRGIRSVHGPDSRVLVFCVMPDHLHTVVLNRKYPLQSVVRPLKRQITQRLKNLGFFAPVWQRGYYDHVIRREEGLFKTIRYVLMNPVRAGLAEDWREYPWSGSVEWPDLDDSFMDDAVAERIVTSQLLGTD
jgi:putative transposase